MTQYLLMNIGCLECGVSSQIVGVYTNKAFAEDLAKKLESNRTFSWREGGQNSYEVFELPLINSTHTDYKAKGGV